MIPPKAKSGRKPKYKHATLNVGEFFTVPEKDYRKAMSAASNYARMNGGKYAGRKVESECRIYKVQ